MPVQTMTAKYERTFVLFQKTEDGWVFWDYVFVRYENKGRELLFNGSVMLFQTKWEATRIEKQAPAEMYEYTPLKPPRVLLKA